MFLDYLSAESTQKLKYFDILMIITAVLIICSQFFLIPIVFKIFNANQKVLTLFAQVSIDEIK